MFVWKMIISKKKTTKRTEKATGKNNNYRKYFGLIDSLCCATHSTISSKVTNVMGQL